MEETDAQVPNEPTLKRKRGRPRKSEPLEQQPAEKRARGRPRKSDISHDVAASVEPSETPATTSETTTPQTYHRPLTSTSDRDSVGVPTTVEKRPRGRPRKYKTKEEYQEAGKQYRRAHKARKSMLAAGTIRLPPAVNGADDDETDGDSVLDDDDVIADLPKVRSASVQESQRRLPLGPTIQNLYNLLSVGPFPFPFSSLLPKRFPRRLEVPQSLRNHSRPVLTKPSRNTNLRTRNSLAIEHSRTATKP